MGRLREYPVEASREYLLGSPNIMGIQVVSLVFFEKLLIYELKAKGSTLWDAEGSAFWETPLGILEARKGKRIANWRDHPKLANSLYKK